MNERGIRKGETKKLEKMLQKQIATLESSWVVEIFCSSGVKSWQISMVSHRMTYLVSVQLTRLRKLLRKYGCQLL